MNNLQFLSFYAAVLKAVHKHHYLLMASVASLSNSYRLGGGEAPPAVMSVFSGSTLYGIFKSIMEMEDAEVSSHSLESIKIVNSLPEIFPDNTDRNRTSPFAFTGNRFEFRAVGSSANCAGAVTTLNAAVAEQLIEFKKAVDIELAGGKAQNVAIMDALKPIIASIIDVICFDGNGYSAEWHKEAARRGLDVETSVPEMIAAFTKPDSIKMFNSVGVYSEKELEARNEVKWETYCKKIQIEARVIGRMAINHIIPTALAYQKKLLENIALMKQVFSADYETNAATEIAIVKQISSLISDLRTRVDEMIEARKEANVITSEYEKAKAYYLIAESLFGIRTLVDTLEEIVDNDMWPLPKYRELLFIN
jgi:glutamine synthetase